MSSKAQSLQSISSGKTELETLDVQLLKKSPKRKKTLSLPSLSNIAALFVKNWITMKRNFLLLLFVFFLPASILLVNSLFIGHSPTNLPLALVNLENSCADQIFRERCEADMLGCYFQTSLNSSQTISLIPYANISRAEDDLINAVVRGVVVVPENLSVSYLKRILGESSWRWEQFLYFYDVVHDGVATNETISISLDSSDPTLVLFIKRAVTEAVDDMVADISGLCEEDLGDGGIDLSVVTVESPLLGPAESDYREWITPAMICVTLFFLAMALTSESFITERSQGLLERSWVTGVLPIELIVSYIMSQFLVMAMQVEIDFIVSINSILTGILFSI